MITSDQENLFKYLRKELNINDEQDKEIRNFVLKMKKIRERGLNDEYAKDTIKTAISGLSAVGVPITAIYFSGSVVGLSAAGITSGLAALGLGAGMVPGIGTAILLGVTVFMILAKILDIGDKRKKEKFQKERERRAEQVIKNLQETINDLIERIEILEKKADDSEANKKAVEQLTKRITLLKQIIENKKRGIEYAE
ncbi:hypothetical protein XO10_02170 [Marinitoga sp. 1135]|nr:hypothetical protein [Marinitoga sp. 1135]